MMRRATLQLEQWPHADRLLWEGLTRKGGPFDDQGALAHLRAPTLNLMAVAYGRWLSWIASACPEVLVTAPVGRVTPERLRAWCDQLGELAPASRHMLVNQALRVLMAAFPERDWHKCRRLIAYLEHDVKEHLSDRKQGRILSSTVLLNSALQLAGPEADAARTKIAQMKSRRDGCLLAFLALVPLRRRAMAALELGKSMILTRSTILISLTEDMTKSGNPWQTEIPTQILPLMHRYIEEVRPWLLEQHQQAHDMLWVTDKGQPLTENYLSAKVRRITYRLYGIEIPPHFFRDAAATTLARVSPERSRLIRPLLGHSSHATAERFYNHANTLDAARDYAKAVNAMRKGS